MIGRFFLRPAPVPSTEAAYLAWAAEYDHRPGSERERELWRAYNLTTVEYGGNCVEAIGPRPSTRHVLCECVTGSGQHRRARIACHRCGGTGEAPVTTTVKKSSKVGQAAKKAPAKKTPTTAKPTAAAKAPKVRGVQPVPDRRPANILAVMVAVLFGSLAAVGGTMSYNAERQGSAAPAPRPAAARAVAAPVSGTCEARNAEALKRGLPPVDCGGAK